MGSVVRRMRRRKRSLGEVRVLRREEYQGLELNAKVELMRSLIPLGLMHVQRCSTRRSNGGPALRDAETRPRTSSVRNQSATPEWAPCTRQRHLSSKTSPPPRPPRASLAAG